MCRTAAQNAIREAARQGLLVVQERRREGRRNDANVVRIISAEWKTWIVRGAWFTSTPSRAASSAEGAEQR